MGGLGPIWEKPGWCLAGMGRDRRATPQVQLFWLTGIGDVGWDGVPWRAGADDSASDMARRKPASVIVKWSGVPCGQRPLVQLAPCWPVLGRAR